MNGTPSTVEPSAQPASTNGLKLKLPRLFKVVGSFELVCGIDSQRHALWIERLNE